MGHIFAFYGTLYDTVYDESFLKQLGKRTRETLLKKQGKRERRAVAKPDQPDAEAGAESMLANQGNSLLMYKRASGKPLLCSGFQSNATAPLPIANDDSATYSKSKSKKSKQKKKQEDD